MYTCPTTTTGALVTTTTAATTTTSTNPSNYPSILAIWGYSSTSAILTDVNGDRTNIQWDQEGEVRTESYCFHLPKVSRKNSFEGNLLTPRNRHAVIPVTDKTLIIMGGFVDLDEFEESSEKCQYNGDQLKSAHIKSRLDQMVSI